MAEIRTEVEDAPGQDGVLVFPPFEGGQEIVLGGHYNIVSTGVDGAYQNAIEAVEADLVVALLAMKTAADDLTWTGGGGGSISVWLHRRLVPTGTATFRGVQFGLMAGDVT